MCSVNVKLSYEENLCDHLFCYSARMSDAEMSAALKPYGYLVIRISK